MQKTIQIEFDGFYNTIASDRAEDTAFHNFIYENDIKENADGQLDVPEDMSEVDQEKFWDYYSDNAKEYEKEVAIVYMDALAAELGIKMTFESIDSPRQYNYGTDRLFVDVEGSELLRLYNSVDKSILADVIKDTYTSYDGFSSFYENDIQHPQWSDPTQFDHNQWKTVLDAYIKEHEIELSELYYI